MKILLVAHGFPRYSGDMAGAFLLSLARGQQALGHSVIAVVPHAAGLAMNEEMSGVEVRRYRYGPDASETLAYAGTMAEQVLSSWSARFRLGRFLLAARRAVRKAVRELRPDVIHVHWWFPGGLAVWPSTTGGIPVVLTSHGTDLFLLDRAPAALRLARPVFRRANQVTVISSPLEARVAALGVPASRVTVVPMPVEPEAIEESPDTGAVREPGLVLFVGRLIERKGAEFAIRALAVVRERDPRSTAHLLIAGDGPERERIEVLVRELGVGDAVQMAGALSRDAVTALYRRAAVFVMSAVTDWKGEQEGFGMVIVEAMLHALPVIASRSGGIPDIVRDGENGLLVPERDVPALADAMQRVLTDDAFASRLGHAARDDARQRFSPRRIAAVFHEVYSRAVGGSDSSHGEP